MSKNRSQLVTIADGPQIDAFGRKRVSMPTNIFDCQMTYDLQPLIFEQLTNGAGASISHDSTNREALLTFSSTPSGGYSILQSFEYLHYQPGKSQEAAITFNFVEGVSDCLKFVGYSDGVNGIEFQLSGENTKQFVLYSGTDKGNQTKPQNEWNLDRLNGEKGYYNQSGLTLDITKGPILIIDLQALYRGRVRIGFDIDGVVVYCHEFLHSNIIAAPYIQTANLPIRAGMSCTGMVSTTMNYTCSAVVSEGGQENINGYEFSVEGIKTAASGTRTHILSLRPKPTFNGFTNRVMFQDVEISVANLGNNPIKWELVIGQAITGTTDFLDVNSNYSAFTYNTLGSISGSPQIVVDGGYVAATGSVKNSQRSRLTNRHPITLDAAGNVRSLGTLSTLVTGIGGVSDCRVSMKWKEIR